MLCLLVYNANGRSIGAVDTLPARYLPLILWHSGTVALDGDARMVAHGYPTTPDTDRPAGAAGRVTYLTPWALWMIHTRDHRLASLYPVVTPLLVAPLYVPANLWLDAHGRDPPRVDRVAEVMEKLSASLLASIASVLVFLTLRRERARGALPIALAFAFGTNTWTISSQALWQHGTGELLIALALLLAVAPATRARLALLGAVCVLMTFNRPPDGLIAAGFGAYALWAHRRGAAWLVAGGIVPFGAALYYNLVFIGSVAGGYGLLQVPASFYQPIWSGLAGLVISPARGLLVFTPFLIFLPWGFMRRLRDGRSRALTLSLAAAVAAQILFYALGDWRAGVSWGPRWLTDILPILVWMLVPAFGALRPRIRWLFVAAVVASVAIQAIGAFWYRGAASDARIFANPGSMRGAWDPRNLPYFVELGQSFARPDLQCDAGARISRVDGTALADAGQVPTLRPGGLIEGQALACGGKLPAALYVLIDGIKVGETNEFAAGPKHRPWMTWRVRARTLGVQPGERVLQVAVFVKPSSSSFRIVREQRVFVVPPAPSDASAGWSQSPVAEADLRGMAARAAALLRARQAVPGYWLTDFTSAPAYAVVGQEMNTYLTSVMVDMLSPLERRGPIEAAMLDRARRHLAAQIESSGLARYHGLPDAPTIGTLGCAITPDPDDTALIWRVAGDPNDPRRKPMLAELARYRDARGLYRTWLAPVKQYQCLAPGGDPNPTDMTIQLHIYIMLRAYDPPAATALCAAMRRAWSDSDVWPYYSQTALMPYLRAAEVRRLGCAVPLPAERLALPVAGQDIWSEAVRLLAAGDLSRSDPEARDAIRRLLTRLGDRDFALLRQAPPLIYHNDLSSAAKRFYWSPDLGYAIWLRLYDMSGAAVAPPAGR